MTLYDERYQDYFISPTCVSKGTTLSVKSSTPDMSSLSETMGPKDVRRLWKDSNVHVQAY